jgi:hypothetical protein
MQLAHAAHAPSSRWQNNVRELAKQLNFRNANPSSHANEGCRPRHAAEAFTLKPKIHSARFPLSIRGQTRFRSTQSQPLIASMLGFRLDPDPRPLKKKLQNIHARIALQVLFARQTHAPTPPPKDTSPKARRNAPCESAMRKRHTRFQSNEKLPRKTAGKTIAILYINAVPPAGRHLLRNN